MSIIELVLRVIITILTLLVVTRLNGPKQVSQMNFYDYIVGIAAGSLAASVSIDSGVKVLNGLTALVLFLLSALLMSWLARKSMTLRRFLSGEPILLVHQGQVQWQGLKHAHMNINELLSALRYGGYYNLAEIYTAILEPTGKLSVQPRGNARPAKTRELQLSVPEASLLANVVIDGKMMADNLRAYGKDEGWLTEELRRQGVQELREVGLATLSEQGALSIYRKEDRQTNRTPLI